MNLIQQLTLSLAFILVNLISCMDKPLGDKQDSHSPSEIMHTRVTQLDLYNDAMEAYRAALASPAVDGLTEMQKAKQYLKAQIVNKKQEIAQVKVAVNFDFLANQQIPDGDKYDCLCDWQNKVEAESPLRIELMGLKLAYDFTKLELIKHAYEQISNEIKPYFPPFIAQ